ncbi:MAG TPA: molybdopterin-dependent oxidoreductase [Dehalococcoidia bacterium]|nr:molybdopterin-dependent oxidoreductase [Dehalococcoidia bacterium]
MVLYEGIRPPKFADRFHRIDFAAEPMPVLSLYPYPEPVDIERLEIEVCGLDCKPRRVSFMEVCDATQTRLRAPLICQIFNWAREVEWSGVRLCDFLERAGLEAGQDDYLSFWSRDGGYFESLSVVLAQDPRVLLATHLNGEPLSLDHGGPVRLVVPFLQGYKSVKWLGAIRVLRCDPIGIKRLLGQSKSGHLGKAWLDLFDIEAPAATDKTPV